MRTPAEYRKEAEEYVMMAQGIPDPVKRLHLLEMAQSCLRLAEQMELFQAEGSNGHDGLSPFKLATEV